MLSFIQQHITAIYFSLGSLSLFIFILISDHFIQRFSNKTHDDISINNLSEEDKQIELKKGLDSLEQAWGDSVIDDVEYETLKKELTDKYH